MRQHVSRGEGRGRIWGACLRACGDPQVFCLVADATPPLLPRAASRHRSRHPQHRFRPEGARAPAALRCRRPARRSPREGGAVGCVRPRARGDQPEMPGARTGGHGDREREAQRRGWQWFMVLMASDAEARGPQRPQGLGGMCVAHHAGARWGARRHRASHAGLLGCSGRGLVLGLGCYLAGALARAPSRVRSCMLQFSSFDRSVRVLCFVFHGAAGGLLGGLHGT
jgi:hypothetical protein